MNYAALYTKLTARASSARAMSNGLADRAALALERRNLPTARHLRRESGRWDARAARLEAVAGHIRLHVFFGPSNQWSAFEREAEERGRRLEDSGWCCADY